jgi:transposase
MGEQRRKFSDEFKREAVRLAYESGRRLVDVAQELELRPDMIRRWRRKFSGGGQGAVGTIAEQEVRRLQRELSLVREERDILKKALAIFSDRRR